MSPLAPPLDAEPGPDGVFRVTPASLEIAGRWRDRDGDAAFWSAWIRLDGATAGEARAVIGLDLSTRPDVTAFHWRTT